jgi:DNA modification methylase
MTSIKDLKSDHKNARKRTDRSAKLIAESLQRFGAARSIVIDEENRILAGNGTIEGAKAAGIKNVRVIETDGTEIIAVKRTGLSEDEKIGLALADNRTSDLSDWDKDMLQQLSEEHDIAPWFDADDLAEILGTVEQLPAEGLTDADEVPEAPAEPITKPGDLWILGNHRLLCGDSTNIQHVERLMDGKKADMVFTDPPYGVGYKPKATAGEGRSVSAARLKGCANDTIANDATLEQAYEIAQQALALHHSATAHFVCCDWKSYAMMQQAVKNAGIKQKACIVWDKGGPYQYMDKYAKGHEFIIYAGPFGGEKTVSTDIWSFPREFRPDHPTPKPVDLICNALSHFPLEKIVVDVFGGSGSTLIACEKTSRHCRMMELDPAYCDVIVQRWQAFTGKLATLEEIKEAF